MPELVDLEIEFPEKLAFLINEPSRYKVIYGGRGGMKTETIARALVILCMQRRLRILCLRELQKSIAESVYENIKFAIIDMGLESEFDIRKATIICKRTRAHFLFAGLKFNIDKLKSYSRIDIAWVEEARNVSKTSWDKLGPTIRGRHESDPNGMGGPFGKGPEIWVSFNPELDGDETYKRFVLQRIKYAPEFITNDNGQKERFAIVIKTSYRDNKWLPNDLKQEMQLARDNNPDDYLHVWEGNTKQVLDGAIYADEIRKVIKEERRGIVRYDPSRAVHTFWDLGYDDYTSIWFVQQIGVHYNLINFFQDRLKKIPYFIKVLQDLGYVYGRHYLPHDGDNETLASRSIYKIVKEAYPSPGAVKLVPRVPKKIMGIRAGRAVFDLCNFDEENTADGWQCLCNYTFAVNEDGVFSKEPNHDEWSHGADAFQTFALHLKPETAEKKIKTVSSGATVHRLGNHGTGWMS